MIQAAEARNIAKNNLENNPLYTNIEKNINDAVANSQNSTAVKFAESDFTFLPTMIAELYALGYSTRVDKEKTTLFIHW